MKQIIRLAESDLHKIVKESVKKVLNEESYRKAAKKGEHTSSLIKHGLKNMGKGASKDFHKFARKNNLDKTKGGAAALCNWEDGCDDSGKYIGNNYNDKYLKKMNESSMNDNLSFKMQVWDIINEALYNTFGDCGVGNGWDVINPDNENEYVHITFNG